MGSLRLRMLAAMLIVAIVASVLAGLLARRQTVEAIREAAQSDLETEVLISEEVLFYAVATFSWDGIGELVEELGSETGTRIAVVALDGEVLADSDPGAALPEQSRSFLDPSELLESFEGEVVFGEDDEFQVDSDFFEDAPEPALLYLGYGVDELVNSGDLDLQALLLSGLALVALAGGLSFLVASRVSGPVRRLITAVDRLAEGDLGQRVPDGGGGEVGSLATSFNAMAQDLQSSEVARSNMVSDVAHELRNPVGVLQGSLEAAQDGLFEIDHALVDSLHDETLHLSRLVEDLQQLALADAGALAVHPVQTDVGDLVTQVANSHLQAATDTGLSLSTLVKGSIVADVDPTRIHQVVSNLLANAIAYTPEGGTVTTRALIDGAEVVISISDTGVGLSAEELPKVFDRFWRADQSRTRATGGSGVGLSICKELVESHSGTITAVSEPGVGSTFTVRLPAIG